MDAPNDNIGVDLTATRWDDRKVPLEQRNVYGTNGNDPRGEWTFKIYFFPKGIPVPPRPCADDYSKTVFLHMACCQLEGVDDLLKDLDRVRGIYYPPTSQDGPSGDIEATFGTPPDTSDPGSCPAQVDLDVDCYVIHIDQGTPDMPLAGSDQRNLGLMQLSGKDCPWQFWFYFLPQGTTPRGTGPNTNWIQTTRDWSEFKTIRELLRGGNVHVTYKDATLGGPKVCITKRG